MKVPSCYNCGAAERTFYAEENGFSLVKCSGCGLLYVQERPDDTEISQAHKQGKHSGVKELDVTGVFSEDKIRGYLGVLEDLFAGEPAISGSWLDIGCGHGEFIAAVQQYSKGKIAAHGTEPNVHKQKSAREHGLDVTYFDLDAHEDKYDFISLLNVYSHLPNPPEFIGGLKRLLKPDGEIILQTGDTAGFSAEEHYKPFSLPDHLSFASEQIVKDILRRQGFEILDVCKYPFVAADARTVVKELVKTFLPRRESRFHFYAHWKRYSQTDMFVRAKMISPP